MKFILFTIITAAFIFSGCERPTDVSPDNGIPPAVPTGIYIRFAQDGEILLLWQYNSEPDFKNYRIYRSINKSTFQLIFETTNDYYFDDSLNYNDFYTYKITAVDQSNTESTFSDSVSAYPVNKFAPDRPGKNFLSAHAVNSQGRLSINLSWNPNENGDIQDYIVYRDSLTENFTPDSLHIIGTTTIPEYIDTTGLSLYKNYYYKIKARDKGGLLSIESNAVFDMVLGIPIITFPANNSRTSYFTEITVKTLPIPARYRIILQSNPYFGEIWSAEFSTNSVNETLKVSFNPPYIEANVTYYLRIAAFTGSNTEPNSVSELYQFVINP